MSWADSMAALGEAILDTLPDSFWFNGAEIDCVAPSLDIFKTINPNTYDAQVTFSFQARKTEVLAAGIALLSEIVFNTPFAAFLKKDATQLTFLVKHVEPDVNISLVNIICNLKQ